MKFVCSVFLFIWAYSNLFQNQQPQQQNRYSPPQQPQPVVPDIRTKYNTQPPPAQNKYNVAQQQPHLVQQLPQPPVQTHPSRNRPSQSLPNYTQQQTIPQQAKKQEKILPSKPQLNQTPNLIQNRNHTSPHSATNLIQPCDVPSDFWCDSYEIAQRCNVVAQCERLKRERRPLVITLMFEAMCPFCQRFITNHLGNLYSQFGNKIEVELNGQISCNHGPTECDANRLMSCVLDEVKTAQAIPFIICFEKALTGQQTVDQAFHHCAGFVRNAYRQIKQCHTSERGKQLQRQAAYRTMNVQANKIVEVPYILINNYSPNTDANALNILSLHRLLQKWLNLRT